MRPALFATCLIAAHPAVDAASWRPLREPGGGGWITGVRVSPHDGRRVLLGGDMLGIRRSTDRGASWRPALGPPSSGGPAP